jgi:hypothetical protein
MFRAKYPTEGAVVFWYVGTTIVCWRKLVALCPSVAHRIVLLTNNYLLGLIRE